MYAYVYITMYVNNAAGTIGLAYLGDPSESKEHWYNVVADMVHY